MADITHDEDGHPFVGVFDKVTKYLPEKAGGALEGTTRPYEHVARDAVNRLKEQVEFVADARVALAAPALGAPYKGRKDDSGKVRMELLNDVSRAIKGIAEVLTWAVTKKTPVPYEPGSWQNVDDFYNRYFGAMLRHINNVQKNGYFAKDKETALLDMKHVLTNAAFLVEKLERELEQGA